MSFTNLRYPFIGIGIFAILITFFIQVYIPIEEQYGLPTDYSTEGDGYQLSVTGRLQELNLITDLNQSMAVFYTFGNPNADAFDILGSLAASAVGAFQVIGGLFIFPVEIITILISGYGLPPIFSLLVSFIVVATIGFILVSVKLGKDV